MLSFYIRGLQHHINMHTFLITISQAGGVSEEQFTAVEQWLEALCVKCVSSREEHKSGLLHFHCVVEDANAKAQGLKRKLVRALGEVFDFTPHNSLDVKLVTEGTESRVAGYVVKDENVYVNNGWCIADLLKERLDSLKQQVNRTPKSTFMLNEKNVEELILEYAKSAGMPLTCKLEYLDIVVQMGCEGYSFSRVKPEIVYAQVMGRAGNPEFLRDWWEMKLGNLR